MGSKVSHIALPRSSLHSSPLPKPPYIVSRAQANRSLTSATMAKCVIFQCSATASFVSWHVIKHLLEMWMNFSKPNNITDTTLHGLSKCVNFFTIAQQPPSDQALLIIGDSPSHSDTPQSVGILCTSEQPDADSSTCTRDIHPCPRRDSNPISQHASGWRPTPQFCY